MLNFLTLISNMVLNKVIVTSIAFIITPIFILFLVGGLFKNLYMISVKNDITPDLMLSHYYKWIE